MADFELPKADRMSRIKRPGNVADLERRQLPERQRGPLPISDRAYNEALAAKSYAESPGFFGFSMKKFMEVFRGNGDRFAAALDSYQAKTGEDLMQVLEKSVPKTYYAQLRLHLTNRRVEAENLARDLEYARQHQEK